MNVQDVIIYVIMFLCVLYTGKHFLKFSEGEKLCQVVAVVDVRVVPLQRSSIAEVMKIQKNELWVLQNRKLVIPLHRNRDKTIAFRKWFLG